MLDQFHPCIQDFIENIIDVKADGNCGYRAIAALLGIGEESWSLVRNHLHKELTSWSEECGSNVFQVYFDDAKDSSQESRVKQVSKSCSIKLSFKNQD